MTPALLAACAVGLIILLLVGLRPTARRRWSARWIRDHHAAITPALRREVEDVRWRQRTGAMAGGLVGLAVVAPVSLRFDPTDDDSMLPALAVMIVPFVLVFVGAGVGGLIAAMQQTDGSIRVAPSQAPRHSDFVSWPGLMLMRAQMVVLIAAGLAATQLPSWTGVAFSPVQAGFLGGSIVVIAVAWIVSELLARRLVCSPLPSGDPVTLFWRTALRGERLREIFRLPACLGYLAPLVISQALPRFYGTPAMSTGPDIVLAFSLLAIGLCFASQLLLLRMPQAKTQQTLRLAAGRSREQV